MPKESSRRLVWVLVTLAGLLLLAAAVGVVWSLRARSSAQTNQQAIEPAQVTTPTASMPPSSSFDTSNEVPALEPTTEVPATGTAGPIAGDGAFKGVAFRLGSSLYVAREDGTGARSVIRSASGPYSLSPDGKTVAVIEDGVLSLVDVTNGSVRRVDAADPDMTPSWSSDSTRVVYRKKLEDDTSELWVARVDGAGNARVGKGDQAVYSTNGDVLAVLDGQSGSVALSVKGGSLKKVAVRGGTPTAVAASASRLFVGLSDGQRGTSILSMKLDGSDTREIAGRVPGDYPAIWGDLVVSPDGRFLGVQSLGDDGYARACVVPTGGGTCVDLTRRRDALIHGWSRSASRLFLVEGNAFQGEPTTLVSVKRDGSSRHDVVTGAQ